MQYWSPTELLVLFTVCITPLVEVAVFLTASVMADNQIHYNLKNNTVLCHECSFKSFLGKNVHAWTSNMRFVNKDMVYFKICFDVFGDGRSMAVLTESA